MQVQKSVKSFFLVTVSLLICSLVKEMSHWRWRQGKAGTGTASYRHALGNNDSADTTVSEASFAQTCQREDLHQTGSLLLSSTSPDPIAPSSGKVACPRLLTRVNFTVPLTALLSFAGSGNTWTRHLLQQLTGIGTGSGYDDDKLRQNGFPFEGEVENVIVVKTHNFGRVDTEIPLGKYERVIFVVRNIYDSILADSRRKRTRGNHTASVRINTESSEWRPSLLQYLKEWDGLMREAFSFPGPTLLLFYEDLTHHLLPQLKRMAEFLACDHLKEFSFCCALKESEGAFHRKPNDQTVEMVFGKGDRKLVNTCIEGVAEFLKKANPYVSARILTYRMPV